MIPTKSQSQFNTEDEYLSQSCPAHPTTEAIMVYPGVYPQTPGIITAVTANYNSYNTLCSIIGRRPTNISLQYTPSDHIKYPVDDPPESSSYFYILHYDDEAQKHKKPSEFNQIVSHFTKMQFWGRIIIIDENIGHPIITHLHGDVNKHSF